MLAGRSPAPEKDNDHHLRVDDLGDDHLGVSGGKSKRSLACLPSASLGGLGWQGDCVRDTSPTSSVYIVLSVCTSRPAMYASVFELCSANTKRTRASNCKAMFGWTSKWERLPLTSDTSTLPSSGPSLNIDHLCPHLHVEVVFVCIF